MRALAAVLVSTLILLGVMMLAQSLSMSGPSTGREDATAGGPILPADPGTPPQPTVSPGATGDPRGTASATSFPPLAEPGARPHVWPTPDPRTPGPRAHNGASERRRGRDSAALDREDRLTALADGFDDWVNRTKVRIAREPSLRTRQAVRMFDAGLYAQSADAYRAALALDPTDADAWAGLGRALSAGGEFDAAADAYAKAVTIEPHDATAQYNLGVTLVRLDRSGDAIEAFRRAVIADPYHRKSLFNLATLTELDGRLAEARYWWEQLAAVGGATATDATASAGRVALRQGATDDALRLLGDAFLAQPTDAEIVRPLAVAIEAESFNDDDINVDAAAWRCWLMILDPHGERGRSSKTEEEVAMGSENTNP